MTGAKWLFSSPEPRDDGSWVGAEWMDIEQALAVGVPREVIEAAWRESDEMFGTTMAPELIRKYFGGPPQAVRGGA